MLRALQGLVTAVTLLAFATVTAEAQVNMLAPVLKSNSKGTFKPYTAKGNAEFDVTVRLYEDSAADIQIEDDSRMPWEETLAFSVQGKAELPASDPASGEYSLYVPVDGFVDLNIGAQTSTPLPADLGSGFVYFTTEVTPYKKGVAQTPYDESPTKLLARSAPERYMSLVDIDDGQGGAAKTLRLKGANLQIVDGSGATAGSLNGLGNLIVGYNELRGGGDDRTGSHNIVVGREHNYTKSGGFVSGLHNTLEAGHATVSGGYNNTASGNYSSVSGGSYNTASSTSSSVSGGLGNESSAPYSSVSGGAYNTAGGYGSSVSGGLENSVSGGYASVSGGYHNEAEGYTAWIGGGSNNLASGGGASVSGGYGNEAGGSYASVSGGRSNTASGNYSSVSGGQSNGASGSSASVSGGWTNTASGFNSSVSGGQTNTASSFQSSVSGGANRSATSTSDWAAGALFEDS